MQTWFVVFVDCWIIHIDDGHGIWMLAYSNTNILIAVELKCWLEDIINQLITYFYMSQGQSIFHCNDSIPDFYFIFYTFPNFFQCRLDFFSYEYAERFFVFYVIYV